jgi:DMSO/TMAO reductase YedYZ molybdopterin-dependent catalytic subunit
MPQTTARLPIACVEGWSVSADWSGVPLQVLLDLAEVPPDTRLRAVSLEQNWLYASSPIGPSVARDPLTLLALRLNGEPLDLDHGYPLRLIAPNRPGVHQTKWLARIEPA